MNWFTNTINTAALFIEREAGHVVTSWVLIYIGMAFLDPSARGQAARDLLMVGVGVLGRSMGSNKSKDNLNGNAIG